MIPLTKYVQDLYVENYSTLLKEIKETKIHKEIRGGYRLED